MNKLEFAKVVTVLKTAYPKNDMLETDAQKTVWYECLKDLDAKVAQAAAQRIICRCKWFPTVAEIREEAMALTNPVKDWGDGWQQVIDAIRFYGMYQEEEALKSLDDMTRQCVKRLGWKQLCISENIMADRANFRMVFEEISRKQAYESQVPPELRIIMQERGLIE